MNPVYVIIACVLALIALFVGVAVGEVWAKERKKKRELAWREAKKALESNDVKEIEDVLALYEELTPRLRAHLERRRTELRADAVLEESDQLIEKAFVPPRKRRLRVKE